MINFTNEEVLIETFIYKYWYLIYLESPSVFESPYYYYLSKYNINDDLLNWNFNRFKKQILSYNDKYSFLFSWKWYIKDPKEFNVDDLENIKMFINKNKNNFLYKLAYLNYKKNNWDLNIEQLYKTLLKDDVNNIHLRLEYIRFKGSSLYKLYNKDKNYIKSSIKDIKKIIIFLEKDDKIKLTFIYSWLWYLLIEVWNYNKAIFYLNKTIYLNKINNYYSYESFFWKSIALSKLKLFIKAKKNINFILNNNIWLDKIDFRFFRTISEINYSLWMYNLFAINIKDTIVNYLKAGKFHFNNNLILDSKRNLLKFNTIFDKNKYDSFLLYIKNERIDNIDNIIFSIAFLYKEKLLWNDNLFNDSRWIEKLCFSYLKLIYEWKYKNKD